MEYNNNITLTHQAQSVHTNSSSKSSHGSTNLLGTQLKL